MFDLMDWNATSRQFDELVLPTSDEGLAWNIDELHSEGVLSLQAVPKLFTYRLLALGDVVLDLKRGHGARRIVPSAGWALTFEGHSCRGSASVRPRR